MSKRFGRQQKRRMRAEIEALEASNEWFGSNVSRLKHRLQSYEETIALIQSMLGPNWVGLPVQSIEVKPVPGRQHIEAIPYSPPPLFGYTDEALSTIEYNLLEQISSGVFPKDYCNAVHVELTWRGKPYAYAATKEAMMVMPRETLARNIMSSLCDYTAREIHKALGMVSKQQNKRRHHETG